MSAFTEKRSEIQSRYTSLTHELHERLATAGREIVASGALPDEQPYSSLSARESEITDTISGLTRTKDRIVAVRDRLAEIQSARDSLEKRRREIGTELEPHYQTIGEHSFRVFRDNPLIDQEYADIFTPVLNAYEEIRQIRGELSSVESGLSEKPFLEKMVVRGRIIVLRNRVATRENQLERLFREAGKQIAATDFITTIGDPALDDAAAPFLDLSEELQRVEREMGSLDDETSALTDELASLGVERRPATRIQELSQKIGEAEAERNEARASIASAVKGSDVADRFGEEVRTLLGDVESTESEIESLRSLLERLEAAIEADRLSREADQLDGTIARKRDQIAKLSSEIEELERRKAALTIDINAAEQKRGAVEDLLS